MTTDQITSHVVGIILRHVRDKRGRLTLVSDMCRINRREFSQQGIAKMRLYRLVLIIAALFIVQHSFETKKMVDEIVNDFLAFVNDYENGDIDS